MRLKSEPIPLSAPSPEPEKRTVDQLARELGTPAWLAAALRHHFRDRETVTAAEFKAAAQRIANHPIGGR